MNEGQPDFDDTQRFERRLVRAVSGYVHKQITSKVLWGAIGLLVMALVASITWVVSMQQSMNGLSELRKSFTELVKQSQDTRTDVASIKATVGEMKDQQRERWERIEREAEAPPHARRKR